MSIARTLCAAALSILAAVAPAQAQPVLNAMTTIRSGQWQVTPEGQAPHALCLANPEALFQIRHRASACTRLVVADEKASATVHYSCPGAGWGRTTLRVATPDAVRISTQGIAGNVPFDYQAQARRIGDCPARGASR